MSQTNSRETGEGIRLQKVLSQAGVASRRASEIMIDEGRVEVNGRIVTEQGMRVDPERDTIRVDGARIPAPRRHMYLLLNKPRGVVSTMDESQDRRTLAQYVPRHQRLYHVGRLDTDTEGLIILTNDGEFAHRLAHPSYEVRKTYLVEAEGVMDNKTLHRLEKGLRLEDGPIRPDRVKLVSRGPSRTLVQITLHSGRNRIVRRMMDSVGHPVRRLARIGIGPVRLGDLASGDTRELTREELGTLLDIIGM
ncbi:pseudouridine synthase [Propionibacterium australiense]|uniref:Pseudouridine synthase n=1 Tax=Propionibacterium australiense TaxID=119981 RepID=A0A383S8S6_9ACTN|nr:pseudouridine synthase [Propionibacterium australiense]RLP06602.1 pseudouridine synthase [Propionibacterium australiense]RLP10768.1 pseudouridine synthase [Propionibacterium australiense]SYZ34425.1 Rsu family of pseudouridine synthase signature [Propionibacterium australiense]VEH89864.1 Ribosomal large subunit pseudouridine synthase B [Propionibacterium australiense]